MAATSVRVMLVCPLLLWMGGCASGSMARYEYARPEMGTVFRIVLYASGKATADKAADAAFARVEELNKVLSDYDPDSELSRLSRTSGSGQTVAVSDDLWRMLDASRIVWQHSGGAFDITVGPVVKLWRRARRQRELPKAEQIAEAIRAVGMNKIVLDPRRKTATLTAPNMLLDLGGIAKGYASDEAVKVLRGHGIHRALVASGGDVFAGDGPPDRQGWVVELEPFGNGPGFGVQGSAGKGQETGDRGQRPGSRYLLLVNSGVSTSGDANQYVEIGGRRYSHIINPRTGMALTTPMGVSVVAPDSTTADAYATALNVLGPELGIRLIETVPNASAIFSWVNEKGEVETRRSRGAAALRFESEAK